MGAAVPFVIVLALLSPLDAIGEGYLLSAHMLQHVLISDVGPALVFLALSGPLLFFFLPRPALVSVAHNRPARAFLGWLTNPFVAIGVWCAVMAAWHVPPVYDAALTNQWLHDLEHATFLLAGFLVWYQLLDPTGHGARLARHVPDLAGEKDEAVGLDHLGERVAAGRDARQVRDGLRHDAPPVQAWRRTRV